MFDDFDEYNSNEKIEKNKKPYIPNKKKELPEHPYIVFAVYVDGSFPQEIKDKIYHVVNTLLSKGYYVRINGDDKDFTNKLINISNNLEVYIPWKNFNNIESKHYFNDPMHKKIAASFMPGYENLPEAVKSLLARNVRLIFGDKLNSTALCLITWSSDGALHSSQVNKETGKASFLIRLMSKYRLPVFNIGSEKSLLALEKNFLNV